MSSLVGGLSQPRPPSAPVVIDLDRDGVALWIVLAADRVVRRHNHPKRSVGLYVGLIASRLQLLLGRRERKPFDVRSVAADRSSATCLSAASDGATPAASAPSAARGPLDNRGLYPLRRTRPASRCKLPPPGRSRSSSAPPVAREVCSSCSVSRLGRREHRDLGRRALLAALHCLQLRYAGADFASTRRRLNGPRPHRAQRFLDRPARLRS